MITAFNLSMFYDLLHKSATVLLLDGVTSNALYCGPVKDIPDEFDDFAVFDFRMTSTGVIVFDIEKVEEEA